MLERFRLNKTLTISLILLVVLTLVLSSKFDVSKSNIAEAASDDEEMFGWGWSQVPGHTPAAGLGWISFNSSNPGAGGNYRVTVNTSTGRMNGYAWVLHGYSLLFSENIQDCPISNPTAARCRPTYDRNTHALSGWALFSYEGEGGGWTGWLNLSGVTGSVVNGVVTFSGNAWGGDVVGNVSFDGVTLGDAVTSFDYTLSNSGNVSVTKTGSPVSGQTTVSKTLVTGTAQSVDLALAGVPSGVSYAISNRTCSPTCTSTITFTVDPSATNGTYQITVTGSPTGPSTQPTRFDLIINGSSTATVSCSASPAISVKIGQSVTWTASASGGTPPYTYTWSGTNIPTSPAPTSNPYSITYTTVGRKTAQATVRDGAGRTSVCDPAGSVYVNLDPKFEEF
jgi:hypothetical protein